MAHLYPPVIPPPMARSEPDLPDRTGRMPRTVELVAGGWLILTPLLWPHTEATAVNAWITGAVVGAVGIYAIYRPRARFMNALVALWLVASTFVLPHDSPATVANDLVIGFAVFIAALFGGRGGPQLR